MKKTILTGIVVLLPVLITLFIIHAILRFITRPITSQLMDALASHGAQSTNFFLTHPNLLLLLIQILVLIVVIAALWVLGFLANKLFFSFLIDKFHLLMLRIPFINIIYKTVREVTDLTLNKKENAFRATTIVNFASESAYTAGVITGSVPHPMAHALRAKSGESAQQEFSTVFVPTSPHPISGILVIKEQKSLIDVEMNVEEMFKFLVSIGAYHPVKVDLKEKINDQDTPPPRQDPPN
ncbi:MAG: hypothetical protein S4CHLAM102_10560 [Chlamydiia bacterium]|nr:hypothetical protein [Chlamydiia bacterium]